MWILIVIYSFNHTANHVTANYFVHGDNFIDLDKPNFSIDSMKNHKE